MMMPWYIGFLIFALMYIGIGLSLYFDFIRTQSWALEDRKDYAVYFLLIVFLWLPILVLAMLEVE
ncbi:hypothetical protein [Geoglobus ahangari]